MIGSQKNTPSSHYGTNDTWQSQYSTTEKDLEHGAATTSLPERKCLSSALRKLAGRPGDNSPGD